MKKRAFALLLTAAALAFSACGGSGSGSGKQDKPAQSEPVQSEPAQDEPAQSEPDPAPSGGGHSVGSGDVGDHHVEIKGASLTTDYDGNPAIVITYAWTNNSEETTSAMTSIGEKAFQDGVQLETAMIMNSDVYDSGASMKDIRPGTTIDVQCAYLLTSTTSVVEFELTEWISFTDEMVTMDFDPASLA